ncbi:MAG: hypothetical protein DMG05_01050 [Acidobacteria bacterium]|nr:MAG: hypothetical protein DMG05_01050 [Acidobacteriota bacterium]
MEKDLRLILPGHELVAHTRLVLPLEEGGYQKRKYSPLAPIGGEGQGGEGHVTRCLIWVNLHR